MKARYSKKVREEAALICSIAASGGVHDGIRSTRVYRWIGDELEVINGAISLAIHAYLYLIHRHYTAWTQQLDAEAEALIRTGWCPGEEL
jgi:sensor histidine kinase YesM